MSDSPVSLRVMLKFGRMRNLCGRLLHKLLQSVGLAGCAVCASGACTIAFRPNLLPPTELQTSLPRIEQIERKLAGRDTSTEEDSQ